MKNGLYCSVFLLSLVGATITCASRQGGVCVCVCVCVYMHTYICVHACLCTCMLGCMHARMHAQVLCILCIMCIVFYTIVEHALLSQKKINRCFSASRGWLGVKNKSVHIRCVFFFNVSCRYAFNSFTLLNRCRIFCCVQFWMTYICTVNLVAILFEWLFDAVFFSFLFLESCYVHWCK